MEMLKEFNTYYNSVDMSAYDGDSSYKNIIKIIETMPDDEMMYSQKIEDLLKKLKDKRG
jgi:hypothetical protein